MSIVKDAADIIYDRPFNLSIGNRSKSSIQAPEHSKLVGCTECQASDVAVMDNIEAQDAQNMVTNVHEGKIAGTYHEHTGR